MSKFKAIITFGGNSSSNTIGTFDTIEEAAKNSWDYAHRKGYTRSNCENEQSVTEALLTRQYCMLGYGPEEIEIEEVVTA